MRTAFVTACWLTVIGLASCSRPATRPDRTVEYDEATGRLRLVSYDSSGKGRPDTFMFMDGVVLRRIERDLDGDGLIDRWDFFTGDRVVEKVGLSSRSDGIMDSQAFYREDGTLARVEISTGRDGTFDRVEFYENGLLARSEEDTDHDGRADKWDTYRLIAGAAPEAQSYAITSTAFDDSGSGRPDRRFVYASDGSILRVEPVEPAPERLP